MENIIVKNNISNKKFELSDELCDFINENLENTFFHSLINSKMNKKISFDKFCLINFLYLINKNKINDLFIKYKISNEFIDKQIFFKYYCLNNLKNNSISIDNYMDFIEYNIPFDINNNTVLLWACKNHFTDIILKILETYTPEQCNLQHIDNDNNTMLTAICNEINKINNKINNIFDEFSMVNNWYEHYLIEKKKCMILCIRKILNISTSEQCKLNHNNNYYTLLLFVCKNKINEIAKIILIHFNNEQCNLYYVDNYGNTALIYSYLNVTQNITLQILKKYDFENIIDDEYIVLLNSFNKYICKKYINFLKTSNYARYLIFKKHLILKKHLYDYDNLNDLDDLDDSDDSNDSDDSDNYIFLKKNINAILI